MDEKLEVLVHLQSQDSTIDLLKRRLEEYPAQKDLLEKELMLSEQNLQSELAQKEEIEKEQRHFERELQAVNDTLGNHQTRLLGIKNNDEYQAVLKEIEQMNAKIGDFEGEILERMTALDEASDRLRGLEAVVGERKKETAEKVKTLDVELARVRDKLKIRQLDRDKIVTTVNGKTLKTYERIRMKKKGVAVVAIQKESCGGCFERLPPQRINEIRMNVDLIYCENCGSILVWDDEGILNSHNSEKKRRERPEQNR